MPTQIAAGGPCRRRNRHLFFNPVVFLGCLACRTYAKFEGWLGAKIRALKNSQVSAPKNQNAFCKSIFSLGRREALPNFQILTR